MLIDWIEIGPCRIVCADCMDVLPTLGRVDAVLTDPPYGIGAADRADGGAVCSAASGSKDYGPRSVWDVKPCGDIIKAVATAGRDCVIWGGNYFTDILPPSMQWLVWDKGQRNFSLADCELAWSSSNRASRVLTYSRAESLRDGRWHPTQKPVAVMEWSLGFVNGPLVLDPFMGSGTTGIACIQAGRRFIGIEKEPKYFELATRRIRKAWDSKRSEIPFVFPPVPVQGRLFDDVA